MKIKNITSLVIALLLLMPGIIKAQSRNIYKVNNKKSIVNSQNQVTFKERYKESEVREEMIEPIEKLPVIFKDKVLHRGFQGAKIDTTKAKRPIAKLFYTEAGTGKNVMLLHGWTCDSNDWIGQLPLFESKYHVVAPDLRGHGWSEVMPSDAYNPDDYVADIEALIATKYPDQKFIIVGHSMGGQIAARLAAKRPDLVRAVVSVDGAIGFDKDAAQFFRKTTNNLKNSDRDPGVVASNSFQLIYDSSTDAAFKRWHARRAQGMPAHVVGESFGPLFFGTEQVGLGEASKNLCEQIEVPFYQLCRDPDQTKRMRAWFSNPKSKVELWSNTGHWIMQDRKDDFNSAVTAWIDAL